MKLAPVLLLLAAPLALPTASGAQQPQVFDATSVVIDADVAPIRRMLDFDLDGDPDGVGAWLNSNNSAYRLYGYRNDGQGGFQRVSLESASTNTAEPHELLIEVGHLNADAWPDVCILYRNERHDWYGEGNGHFTLQAPVTLPGYARKMSLADLDGDGLDDCIWVDGGRLRFAGSQGAAADILVPGVKHALRLLPGDGPGASDIFLLNVNNQVRLFYGDPVNGLSAGPVFQHGLNSAMMDTGDVDGDLDEDAVVFGPASYRVLRRTGLDGWELEPEVMGGPAEFLRDVDGDGDLDGACCGGGGGGGPTWPNDNIQPSDFQIALNDGTGSFAPAFQLPGIGSPQLAGVVDVDGDGDVDLVAGRCVFFSDGGVRPPRDAGTTPPIHGRRALSDCDGDGDVDVGFSVDSVFDNDGTGRFAEQPTSVWPAPPGTRYEGPGYQGDFDGDGDVDLVVELRPSDRAARFSGPLPGHDRAVAMALLCNQSDGTLARAVPATDRGVGFALDSTDPELSLLVDADLDGDLDVLTRSLGHTFDEAGTRYWDNDGTGFFRQGGRFDYARAIWAGDVDLDGVLDLILNGAGYEGTSTYLYLGSDPVPGRLPTLTWDNRPGYWPQQAASGIPAADFDLDGYPDFATLLTAPSAFVPRPAIYSNHFASGGSLVYEIGLTNGVPFELAQGAFLSLADVNGDATVDAVIGPLADELVEISAVTLNQAPGAIQYDSFESRLQVIPPGYLVDIDGDGDEDLLGSRIVFNRSSL